MIYLFLSIFFTIGVFLIIKEFQRYQLNNLQAIVVNYFVAFIIGCLHSKSNFSINFVISQSWFMGVLAISTIFIIVFNLMAITAQKGGLSVMSVANKMSVVVPISVSIFLYHEKIEFLKILGIILALFGVWFTSKKNNKDKLDKRFWYLPFFIFLGSGLADVIINHMQLYYVPQNYFDIFSTSLFLFCGFIGIIVLCYQKLKKKIQLCLKSILGGIILGVPNYFSIYFLLKALSNETYETSLIFSLNNLLIVIGSVIFGVFLYKEKLSKQNIIGLGLSTIAIVIFYFTV